MTQSLFGTDGVRGRANEPPMTAEMVMRIGMAAGQVFNRGGHRHRVVIGKDTRLSGYMIEQALTAGLLSVGVDVLLLGPLPTPAVGFLTRSMRADAGVMISASHNPYEDNGIKLFGPDGFKLSDAVEAQIETLVEASATIALSPSASIGRAKRLDDADGRYIEAIKGSARRRIDLSGLKIVIDCANGAAYKVAPTVLWELGAEVIPIGVTPDGLNINRDCGSTHPRALRASVITHGADIGIALDGDADRVVLVCEQGSLIDGDQLMAAIANRWKKDGRLKGDGVVATVMSNIGLERYVAQRGLTLVRTKVGDRHVVERMRADGLQSGRRTVGAHHNDRPRNNGRRADGGAAGAVGAAQERQARKPDLSRLRARAATVEERARPRRCQDGPQVQCTRVCNSRCGRAVGPRRARPRAQIRHGACDSRAGRGRRSGSGAQGR